MAWRGGGWIAGLALTAVVAGACNGSTAAEPTPSPSPTAAAASPTAEPSPAPSPSPTEVLPANDVEDPVAALQAIVRYRDWLFENPDPDKLKLIYAERCECYEEVIGPLEDAAAEGLHLRYSRPRRFEVVEVVERSGPFAQVHFRQDAPSAELIERDGRSSQAGEGSEQLVDVQAFIVREGGRWLVVALA